MCLTEESTVSCPARYTYVSDLGCFFLSDGQHSIVNAATACSDNGGVQFTDRVEADVARIAGILIR